MTTSTPEAHDKRGANIPDEARQRDHQDHQDQQGNRDRRGKDELQSVHLSAAPVEGKGQDAATGLEPAVVAFYQRAVRLLQRAGIPFMVGGAYALRAYTGITRHTKDFDIFLLPGDVQAALAAFEAAGCQTKMQADYWLAKVYWGEHFVDLIFGSGNGVARVDEVWLQHAPQAEVFDMVVPLTPPEETIWSKSFIMERERFDGADVAHMLLHCAQRLDWNRLLARFGANWRVLLSHLVLFGFIYPNQRDAVPSWVMDRLLAPMRAEADAATPDEPICNGTLLSRQQYLVDVCEWGYRDGRLVHGYMSPEQIEEYTAGIRVDGSPQDEGRLRQLERELREKLADAKPAPNTLHRSESR